MTVFDVGGGVCNRRSAGSCGAVHTNPSSEGQVKTVLLIVVLVGLVASCSSEKSATAVSACPDVLKFAVAVDVRDAKTGLPAGTGGVLYGAHHIGTTAYVDSSRTVTADGLTIYAGAVAGTYDLRLQVPGYATWTDSGVVVRPEDADGACGTPVQVHLQASLQPAA
jgi:hypothetical protein